jgi:hypothetical protein
MAIDLQRAPAGDAARCGVRRGDLGRGARLLRGLHATGGFCRGTRGARVPTHQTCPQRVRQNQRITILFGDDLRLVRMI